jgi:hypothetical protein
MMKRTTLRVLGIGFWIFAASAAALAVPRVVRRDSPTQSSVVDYLLRRTKRVELADRSGLVGLNEPVFCQMDDGQWTQVGHVEAIFDGTPSRCVLTWYEPRGTSAESFQFYAHHSRGQLSEVIATMFPAEKRKVIRDRLETAFQSHGEELMQALIPVVQEGLRQSLPVIESELRASADRHRSEFDELMTRWNEELVDQRLVPMARREIMPIVRANGQPIAESIGRELWDRASLWRFGWRAAYDRSPLPRRDLVQQEWERFVQQDAIPVLESHTDEIVAAVQKTMMEVTANRQVTGELAGMMQSFLSDPDTVDLLRRILKESVIENPRLHQVWHDVASSDDAKRAFALTGERLEPVVRQIGDELFGTREQGINPDFARVLRNQILGKDRRWIVATAKDSASGVAYSIQPAELPMSYPVVYLADPDDLSESARE